MTWLNKVVEDALLRKSLLKYELILIIIEKIIIVLILSNILESLLYTKA